MAPSIGFFTRVLDDASAPERYRIALRFPGVGTAMAVNFVLVLSFAAMEQTFRLFTEDEFRMTVLGTSYVLFFVGVVLVLVQGVLMRPLTRVATERTLIRIGIACQTLGFVGLALSPRVGVLVALYAVAAVAAAVRGRVRARVPAGAA